MLASLQRQIETALKADAVLSRGGISIVRVDGGDALQIAAEAVAAAGTAILIAPPRVTFNPDSSVGPVSSGGVSVVIQVVEAPLVSRAQGIPSAVDLAERIAWLLHGCNRPAAAAQTPLGVSSIAPVRDPDLLVIEVTFTASGEITDPDATEGSAS